MKKPNRDIDDVLHFRDDISPFLVHMTKKTDIPAKENLKSILSDMILKPGKNPVSAAVYARSSVRHPNNWMFKYEFNKLPEEIRICFQAVCFSETPLRFTHCLFDIRGRAVNLEPYGIILIKQRLQEKGVSPVLYLNNYTGDKNALIDHLASAVYSDLTIAQEFIPLLGFAGEFMNSTDNGKHDFQWEREWRYAASKGGYTIDSGDIFMGLCPGDEIEEFEKSFPHISFIDPMTPLEYYATKLISARKKHSMQYSVV